MWHKLAGIPLPEVLGTLNDNDPFILLYIKSYEDEKTQEQIRTYHIITSN
jgi:hypothetical protein